MVAIGACKWEHALPLGLPYAVWNCGCVCVPYYCQLHGVHAGMDMDLDMDAVAALCGLVAVALSRQQPKQPKKQP